MTLLYRKALIYPKGYFFFISLLCFATFVQLRLWEWAFYFNFALFSICFFAYLRVYFSILEKTIRNYLVNYDKRSKDKLLTPPLPMFNQEKIQNILRGTHLIAAIWLIVLPAITLLFYETFFLKLLIVLFLLFFVIATIIRRISFKLGFSLGRSFLLVLQSLLLTNVVSFLPFIALITVIVR